METSTLLKQKATEIVETLGKLYPKLSISDLEVSFSEGITRVWVLKDIYKVIYVLEMQEFSIEVEKESSSDCYSAKTCFGAFTKWINAEIDFHTKEIERLTQLNTNLLGLGERK